MLTVPEIAAALTGLWRLAQLDAKGLECFDRSVEGFWRSFRVALLVAPAYALIALARLAELPVEAGWPSVLLIEALGYVIGWVAFPLAAYHLAQAIGRDAEYVGYIVAYNWSALLQMAIYLPVVLLGAAEILPQGLLGAVGLLATLAVLGFEWFIARAALRLGAGGAAGFVALDVAISLLVTAAVDGAVT